MHPFTYTVAIWLDLPSSTGCFVGNMLLNVKNAEVKIYKGI